MSEDIKTRNAIASVIVETKRYLDRLCTLYADMRPPLSELEQAFEAISPTEEDVIDVPYGMLNGGAS